MFLNHINSPQPPAVAGQALSASQRGARKFIPLLLLAREGGQGDEYMTL